LWNWRFSDIANLKKSNIDYKQGLISCTTIKTGDKAIIPFNDFSREILEKYSKTPNYNKTGIEMAFPTISNQKTNEALKDLGELTGIFDKVTLVHFKRNQREEVTQPKYKLISTHIGRRTLLHYLYG